MQTVNRKPFVNATAALLAVGALCVPGGVVRAADPMMDHPMGDHGMAGQPMMVDEHTKVLATSEMDHAKQMAADPAQAQTMAKEQAKIMVMDRLAESMAHDPALQQAAMAAMTDPNMMKVHEQAMAMAKDPEQMKMMQQEVMADPMAMKMVMHQAMKMATMQDKMMDHGMAK